MNAIAHSPTTSMSGSKLDNRRMLAALIDLAVVGAGAALILAAAGVLGGDGADLGAPLAAVVAGWGLYYYFACESGGGQTLGKRFMNLRVVRVDGSAAGMREVAVRTALRVVDTAIVGLVVMLVTGERRGRVGDLVAGTMIVSADRGPAVTKAAAATAEAPAPVVDEERFAEDLAEERFAQNADEEPLADEDLALMHPVADAPVEELVADAPVEDLVADAPVELAPADPVADAPEADSVEEPTSWPPVPEVPAPEEEPVGQGPELSIVKDSAVELSVVEAPPLAEVVDEEAVAGEPVAQLDPHTLDIATPSLKELADDVAAAKSQREAEAEPVDEVVPVVDAEPVVEAAPVEEDEPVVDAEVVEDDAPVVEDDAPVAEDDAPVSIRSVETVSAIDLIMGDEDPAVDPPAEPGSAPDEALG